MFNGVWVKEHGQVRRVVVGYRQYVSEEMVIVGVKRILEDGAVISGGGRIARVTYYFHLVGLVQCGGLARRG